MNKASHACSVLSSGLPTALPASQSPTLSKTQSAHLNSPILSDDFETHLNSRTSARHTTADTRQVEWRELVNMKCCDTVKTSGIFACCNANRHDSRGTLRQKKVRTLAKQLSSVVVRYASRPIAAEHVQCVPCPHNCLRRTGLFGFQCRGVDQPVRLLVACSHSCVWRRCNPCSVARVQMVLLMLMR